ncbi:MAG: hypothetical protein CVT63_05600 [Candidatus Anoxymicrobium japonicum]|uniref:Squalene cyclase C-terminal domain-containing protein n=1 Tax=Candidatus Anoxymicrobium japonicum TaxID=2013648 RepID=A0A2N3G5J9_9ACTN|nr:MAG: hypothetical protein CVT63_05600 [Candidatus Anoxymicrobium japonicum]
MIKIQWKKALCLCLLVSFAWLATPANVAAVGNGSAIAYIRANQGADGGFAEPGAGTDGLTTCRAMLAGSALGERVADWRKNGEGTLKFLESQAGTLNKLADIELYALAISEAGGDPQNLAGKNLVSLIQASVSDNGRIGSNIMEHCMGLIALAAAGEKIPSKSVSWLVENQRADGGWGESDVVVVTDTALAVEALVGLGQAQDAATAPAMKLLRERMGADGGFAGASKVSNVEQTATVVRSVYATGEDPGSGRWVFHENSPLSFLKSMQATDGHYQYSRGVESQPVMTTSIAVPASAARHFPLRDATARDDTGMRDLGCSGASIVAGQEGVKEEETMPETGEPENDGNASGMSVATGSIGEFWLFLVICAIYLLTLTAAAAIASKLWNSSGWR